MRRPPLVVRSSLVASGLVPLVFLGACLSNDAPWERVTLAEEQGADANGYSTTASALTSAADAKLATGATLVVE